MELTDREMAQDLLLAEKQLTQSYTAAETECANRLLRETIHQLHTETEEMHTRIFNVMHQRGWYKTPVAGQQAIESAVLYWEQQQLRHPEPGEEKRG